MSTASARAWRRSTTVWPAPRCGARRTRPRGCAKSVPGCSTRSRPPIELTTLLEEAETLLALAREGESVGADLDTAVDALARAVEETELATLLTGEHDTSDAILEVHPGAGGTESQDWAEMLVRMYTRWAERRGFRPEVLDWQDGEEAGVKSVTLSIRGPNAYGYLKVERGVHRLVRISPYDAQGRRHTSFASVDILPEVDDTADVEIDDKDLRVDTYPLLGRRRTAREQDRVRDSHHARPERDRRRLPERALAAPQPRAGDEGPAGQAVRRWLSSRPMRRWRARWAKRRNRVGQPDPLVRARAVPAGQGPPHEPRSRRRRSRARRRPRRVHARDAPGPAGDGTSGAAGLRGERVVTRPAKDEGLLDDRAREVLLAVVRRHIHTGEPVGSSAVSRDLHLELSPASVRAIMAELEERGC